MLISFNRCIFYLLFGKLRRKGINPNNFFVTKLDVLSHPSVIFNSRREEGVVAPKRKRPFCLKADVLEMDLSCNL